jgi:hypothetical protein
MRSSSTPGRSYRSKSAAPLPDDVRSRGFKRYNELSPHVLASVDRARRAQEASERAQGPAVAPLPGFLVSSIWEGMQESASACALG